jgi:hypothetical protein
VQFARNDPSLAIKRENGKRGPHNNDRLASSEFDDDFGGAYSLPSKKTAWDAAPDLAASGRTS